MKTYILSLLTLLITIVTSVTAVESANAQQAPDIKIGDTDQQIFTRQAIQTQFTVPLLTAGLIKSRDEIFFNSYKASIAEKNTAQRKWANQQVQKKRKVWWIVGGATVLVASSAILLSSSGKGSSSATIPIPPGRP